VGSSVERGQPRRAAIVALLGLVLVFFCGAVLSWREGTRFLSRHYFGLRLDPTHAGYFVPANRELEVRTDGAARVVLFGDSRIQHWAMPSFGENLQVVNRGYGGDTTAEALLRLDRDVIALNPDLVIIEVGINDLKTIGVFPARRDQIYDQTLANTSAIAGRLNQAGIRVIILSIFPVGPVSLMKKSIWSDATLVAIDGVNRELRLLIKEGVTVFDCNSFFSVDGRMDRQYADDAFHINAKGYDILTARLSVLVRKTVNDDAF